MGSKAGARPVADARAEVVELAGEEVIDPIDLLDVEVLEESGHLAAEDLEGPEGVVTRHEDRAGLRDVEGPRAVVGDHRERDEDDAFDARIPGREADGRAGAEGEPAGPQGDAGRLLGEESQRGREILLLRPFAVVDALAPADAAEVEAEDRETRGFISITTSLPVFGSCPNCTFDPPVSTPISRRTANEAFRMI